MINACHEVGIKMTITLKEKGADLLETFFFFPLKVDTTCVRILQGRKMRNQH